MSETIEVTVRVPADLEVRESFHIRDKVLVGTDGASFAFDGEEGGGSWTCALARQIAAAVEARKPKPPKFQVGDVVEWEDINGKPRAGIVTVAYPANESGPASYCVNGLYDIGEDILKLVRRAEK